MRRRPHHPVVRALLVRPLLITSCAAGPHSRPSPPDAAATAALSPRAVATSAVRSSPPTIVREFRGVWVRPVSGADWPSRPGLPVAQQRAELQALVTRVQALGLNAIVFHVRPAADALYPTTHAPWSAYLTGASGQAPAPAYDPLAELIDAAHARGIQVHAWFNPFRAGHPQRLGGYGATHVVHQQPQWVRRCRGVPWIDPGIPAARQYVLGGILDVVDRYDVDGVHLDDYFYCYPKTRTVTKRGQGARVKTTEYIPFPDDDSWRRYGTGFEDRDAWRRHNIDTFVAALYQETKARKPHVLVGISPFGIWRPGSPPGVTGYDAYAHLHADARRWWREGWVDYLAPQLYWPLDASISRFRPLDAWWRAENQHGRHLWPGLFTRRVGDGTRSAWSTAEIPRQIATLREARAGTLETDGHIHFRLRGFWEGAAAAGALLGDTHYRAPAIVPASPWLDQGAPPQAPTIRCLGDTVTIRAAAGDAAPRWWVVQTNAGSSASPAWAHAVWAATYSQGLVRAATSPRPHTVVVRAVDGSGRLSPPTETACR